MKRDMDLVRQLLLVIKAQAVDARGIPEIDGYEQAEVDHHIKLLRQAGFLPQIERPRPSDFPVRGLARRVSDPIELTWEGHDFLETIRDPEVWRKTKQAVGKAGGTAALETWKATAREVTGQLIGAAIRGMAG